MKDSPQKPPGWEEIWSWGADMGSSSCSLPRGTAWLLRPHPWIYRPRFLRSPWGRERGSIKIQLKRKQTSNTPKNTTERLDTASVHLATIQ